MRMIIIRLQQPLNPNCLFFVGIHIFFGIANFKFSGNAYIRYRLFCFKAAVPGSGSMFLNRVRHKSFLLFIIGHFSIPPLRFIRVPSSIFSHPANRLRTGKSNRACRHRMRVVQVTPSKRVIGCQYFFDFASVFRHGVIHLTKNYSLPVVFDIF